MWTLTLRVPEKEPEEHLLHVGVNTIGRSPGQDISIMDGSASRQHAEIYFDEHQNTLTLTDLGSTNGTYMNRDRVAIPWRLHDKDVIRIGGSTLTVCFRETKKKKRSKGHTRRFTRELLLEALDHHAVLLYEVSHQLNMVTDLDSALEKVTDLMRQAMGADKCDVILSGDFESLGEMGFPTSIAEDAIREQAAIVIPNLADSPYGTEGHSSNLLDIRSAMCVPVMSHENQVIALLYLYKTKVDTRSFDDSDLQLAVAISHQAALTIQRMDLLTQIEDEQRGRQLLQRFLSPQEAEYVLDDYLKSGHLPALDEREATILFADIQGSTELSEKLGAKTFGEVLNRYYWDVTDTVFEYGGLIRYSGDGIMAVFGLDSKKTDHATRAVLTGIAILNHLETIDFGIGVEVIVGVGIATGLAAIGYVGTQQRVELTALGYTVNIAHALQLLARPNRLLVSPQTAVGVAGKYPLADLGDVSLKGGDTRYHAYEVLRQGTDRPDVIQL